MIETRGNMNLHLMPLTFMEWHVPRRHRDACLLKSVSLGLFTETHTYLAEGDTMILVVILIWTYGFVGGHL